MNDDTFMEHCEVGLFKLPGIRFEKEQLPEELIDEMQIWAQENHCGTLMNSWLWSFKNVALRDWFVLRWADEIRTRSVQ
jgi:hypothetical protein